MKRYSPERKEAVLKKLAPPNNLSVPELAQQEVIAVGTLYNWRSQARLKGTPVPGPSKTSDDWSTQAKFAVVVETATLSEPESVLPRKRLVPRASSRLEAKLS